MLHNALKGLIKKYIIYYKLDEEMLILLDLYEKYKHILY
jgi:hypothetical protein